MMDSEDIDELMSLRAVRLLEKNEPELCVWIRAAVARGATRADVEQMTRGVIGRKDTGRMAFYYALHCERQESGE